MPSDSGGGSQVAEGCDWTHVGSIGGGFEDGDDSDEGVRRRMAATAVVSCDSGEGEAELPNVWLLELW
jgi:hypothetical protein